MSEVKTDKLTGVGTADVINITTGSTTSVLQLSIATHTLHFNQQTPAVIQSTNTSSVVDAAAGRYNVTVTSAYSDANSIFTVSCNYEADGQADPKHSGQLHSDNNTGNEVAPTTTTYTVRTDDDSNDKDLKYDYTTRIGDLA